MATMHSPRPLTDDEEIPRTISLTESQRHIVLEALRNLLRELESAPRLSASPDGLWLRREIQRIKEVLR